MITLDDSNIDEHTQGTILVDFWAEWCQPCHMMTPVLEAINNEGVVPVGKIEVDVNPESAAKYR